MRLFSIFVCLFLTPKLLGQGASLASVDPLGAQGNMASINPSVSADGRFVAFASGATNFDQRPTLSVSDIYLHDRFTGITSLITQTTGGGRASGGSFMPEVSGDGRWIVFQSIADNLVPSDTNGCLDVFLYDRIHQVMSRVSVDSNGIEGNYISVAPTISHDGEIITFQSDAWNLVPGDVNGNSDVFIHNRLTGVTSRISESASGAGGNWDSFAPALSADGSTIAYTSHATNLGPIDNNLFADIYQWNRGTGTTTLVSSAIGGTPSNHGSGDPCISGDGRFIAFESYASNLVPADGNGHKDIFLHDSLSGFITRVTQTPAGVEANHYSSQAAISQDGRYITFETHATNLVPGFNPSGIMIQVWDRLSGKHLFASLTPAGELPQAASGKPSISADGSLVTFSSKAEAFLPGFPYGPNQILVKNLAGPTLHGTGSCPGSISISISGGSLGHTVAAFFGSSGIYTHGFGPCQGVRLAISNPTLGFLTSLNLDGIATATIQAPSGACGLTMQAVNMSTCLASNPIELQ